MLSSTPSPTMVFLQRTTSGRPCRDEGYFPLAHGPRGGHHVRHQAQAGELDWNSLWRSILLCIPSRI